MRLGKCPKCSSSDVVPEVSVLDYTRNTRQNLTAVVQQNPSAWLFKGEACVTLHAWVCGDCGFTELYASDPAALLAAYRNRQ